MNSATERTVRAAVYDGSSSPVVTDVVLDPPKTDEVEVAITAAGVCHSDLHVVRGEWQVPMPVVLGHEGSGIITAVGDGVTGLAIGDHVVLSWVAQCGHCRQCLAGHPWQCETAADVIAAQGFLFDGTSRWSQHGDRLYHYLGVSSFAERVVVPESGAIRVRKDAPLDKIAIIGCAVATGVGAVQNTAGVEPDATVAVIGCGGVGLSCIQGARLAQASRIVAADINPDKLETAIKVGATETLCTADIDAVAALRELEPGGFDYVFDAIGKTVTTEQAIQALGQGGAAVIVGLPPTGSTARFDPLALAEANQRILGSNYGSIDPQADIPRLVDLYMDGQIELDSMISGYRPLDDAAAALDELAAGLALRTLLVMDRDMKGES